MIFQKQAKKNSNLEFHIGKETIDILYEYTYLGTRISLCNDLRTNLLQNHVDDTWLTVVIIALHDHCYKL